MKNKLILITFILILASFCNAETKGEPAWVYLKKAENLKEKGEYAQAIIEAKKSREVFINKILDEYFEKIKDENKDKIGYELKKLVNKKEEELYKNDNYPQYHELIADLYVLTDFLDEAEKEYKITLAQNKYFDYPQKSIEIKYKLADIYNKKMDYELEDITYREIAASYFDSKNKEFWSRIKSNINGDKALKIKADPTLKKVFQIYRIDSIEYLEALYKIGRRSAILQRDEEAIFFLANAAIVWMSYYSKLIKKTYYDFQYSTPSDFINYITKKRLYEFRSKDYFIDEIFFFIGYVNLRQNNNEIKDYYFSLAKVFSKNTNREEEMDNRIEYLKKDKNHVITYDEIID